MATKKKVVNVAPRRLEASFKAAPDGKLKRELHGNKKVALTFQLPMAGSWDAYQQALEDIRSGKRLREGKPQFLTNDEIAAIFGATKEHVRQLKATARKHGVKIDSRTVADRMFGNVRLTGRYSAWKSMLPGVKFAVFKGEDGKEHIGRSGMYSIVAEAPPVEGIFDGDNRRAANYYCRPVPVEPAGGKRKARAHGTPQGMTARENAKAWGFPADEYTNLDDLVTAYVSLGGNNGERMQKDVFTLSDERGLPRPKFQHLPIGGAKDGAYRDGATVENVLDALEHALLNPGGHTLVIIADNDDGAFAEAGETAVAFPGIKVGDRLLPLRAYTISWGSPERPGNTVQSLRRWERMAAAARLKGLVITAATGDDGSRDKTPEPTPDAPSCIPGVIGAAGVGFSVKDGSVSEIHIWPSTGGGVSAVFDPLADEKKAGVVFKSVATGREGHNASLIAYEAEPDSGPEVLNNGRRFKVGGTSDASPGIGAMLGRIQAILYAKYGVVLPDVIGFIYEHAKDGLFFKLSKAGSNGDYNQKPEDLCGVPVGFGPINYAGFLAAAEKVAAQHAKFKAEGERKLKAA